MMLVSGFYEQPRPLELIRGRAIDKPEFFKGAPLSLQIVSSRFNDELVIDAVTRVDRILHGAQ